MGNHGFATSILVYPRVSLLFMCLQDFVHKLPQKPIKKNSVLYLLVTCCNHAWPFDPNSLFSKNQRIYHENSQTSQNIHNSAAHVAWMGQGQLANRLPSHMWVHEWFLLTHLPLVQLFLTHLPVSLEFFQLSDPVICICHKWYRFEDQFLTNIHMQLSVHFPFFYHVIIFTKSQ